MIDDAVSAQETAAEQLTHAAEYEVILQSPPGSEPAKGYGVGFVAYDYFGSSGGMTKGIKVVSVEEDSPAEEAGTARPTTPHASNDNAPRG